MESFDRLNRTEESMTNPNLTYVVAREHLNDLLREAERSRRADDAPHSRGERRPLSRLFGYRAASVVDLNPPVVAES
jgi:hypothetical protein